MSSNIFASGTEDDTIEFGRSVSHINIYVDTGVTLSISLDKGQNFMTLPAGFHSFDIGPVFEVQVQADGAWQMIAVQS